MKNKILVTTTVAFLFVLMSGMAAFAGPGIRVAQIFTNQTVAVGSPVESSTIDLNQLWQENRSFKPDGYFSVQIEVTGSGTVTLSPELSLNDSDFLQPTGVSDIVTGFGASSGPNSDGKDMYNIDLGMVTRYLKIKATASGASVTLNAWLCTQ